MRERQQRRMTIGTVLIVIGLAFFLRPRFDYFESEFLLLFLGLLFLGLYLWRRRYGLMVPAGILLGLGTGQLLEEALSGSTEWSQFALGLGFLSVYLVPVELKWRSHWWPLIPGSILVLSALKQTEELIRALFENWPVALIVAGVALLAAGWLGRGDGRSSSR